MNHLKSTFRPLLLLIVAMTGMLMLASCSGKKPFRITGTVEGLGTQNITAIYYDGTALKEVSTNAVNSEFRLEGSADSPRVIELYDKQRNRIGCIVAQNGDEITVKYKAGNPCFMEAAGNEISASLAAFLKKNADSLNIAIEHRLAASPADILSTILATYYYDINLNPAVADSLLSLLGDNNPGVNPLLRAKKETVARLAAKPLPIDTLRLFSRADSIVNYLPSTTSNTLFIFTDINSIPDSIVQYADSMARTIRVVSIRLNIDTFGWHKDTRRFSKKVDHLWAIGGVANKELRPFDIPRLPYFVVVDTASVQIYRGDNLPILP